MFGVENVGERLLFRAEFLVLEGLFRLTKLVFHFSAFLNLPNPFQNDLVFRVKSAIDDKNVLKLVLDGDQPLMRHVILADDPNVSLVEELENRPLGDDESVLERSVDQDGAGLTVTQQAVRVRKIRPEGDVPVLVVELGLITRLAQGSGNMSWLASSSSTLIVLLMHLQVGLVFKVCFLGYVEINPHDAVIGQGREDVPFLDQAALKHVQAVDDAVETCCDLGKVQFGLRQIRLGLGLCQFGLVQFHLILRDTFLLANLWVLFNFSCARSASATAASHFAL